MIAVVVVLSLLDVCIQQVNFIKQKGAFTLPTTESSGLKLITMIYDDWFKNGHMAQFTERTTSYKADTKLQWPLPTFLNVR